MDWITDSIVIGNYVEARNSQVLSEHKIRSILGLTDALEGIAPAALGVEHIEIVPLHDSPDNDPRLFEQAIEILATLAEKAAPVLVHCHAGRSRSVVVVAGYLMKSRGLDAEAALTEVAAKREIAVTPGLERLLDCIF